MKLVDGMIFSTDVLRERYLALNSNSFTVPNCLDIPGHRDWDTPEERLFPDRFVVGWLGGSMHVRDEECMAEGLRAFLDATPSALFAYCGNRNLGFQWKKSIGIRDEQWAFLDPDDFDGYQTRISQFDVGVAPLRNTEFNRSKSDLRLLEYGAWGVPYVASGITPYHHFHCKSDGMGGYLALNPEGWTRNLLNLSDPVERRLRGDAIKGWVREHRGRDACGLMWENALQGAIDNAKRSKPAESVSNPASCGN
jgi:hypothetical protein